MSGKQEPCWCRTALNLFSALTGIIFSIITVFTTPAGDIFQGMFSKGFGQKRHKTK
jgi:hypothetical protein